MSLTNTLRQIGAGFADVTTAYHYRRPDKKEAPYLVWQEDGEGEIQKADNAKVVITLEGSADYYTAEEFDPVIDALQEKFSALHLVWRLDAVQYEEETGLIHYSWKWETSYGA